MNNKQEQTELTELTKDVEFHDLNVPKKYEYLFNIPV